MRNESASYGTWTLQVLSWLLPEAIIEKYKDGAIKDNYRQEASGIP